MTNRSFFLVVYTVVGLNPVHIVQDLPGLLPVVLIALCTTFLLGFVPERICVFLILRQPSRKASSCWELFRMMAWPQAFILTLDIMNDGGNWANSYGKLKGEGL